MLLTVFKRDITYNIIKRLLEKMYVIQVITGLREVGKATGIHQALKEIDNFNKGYLPNV